MARRKNPEKQAENVARETVNNTFAEVAKGIIAELKPGENYVLKEVVNTLTDGQLQTALALANVAQSGVSLENASVDEIVELVGREKLNMLVAPKETENVAKMTQEQKDEQARLEQEEHNATIDAMSLEEVGAALEADGKKKAETVKKTPAKSVKATPPAFQLEYMDAPLSGDNGKRYARVSLNDLIALDDTPLYDANAGLRHVSPEHVQSIKRGYERGDDIPAIRVANSSWGVIVVGGNHRKAALELIRKEHFADKDGKVPENQRERYEQDRKDTVILVEPINGLTPNSIIDFAYDDNLNNNALPIEDKSRSRFAIYLLARAKRQGVKLNVRQAAERADVSYVAVYRMMQRDAGTVGQGKAKVKRQPEDLITVETDRSELANFMQETDNKSKVDRLSQATNGLIRCIMTMYDEVQDTAQLTGYLHDKLALAKLDEDTWHEAALTINEVLENVLTAPRVAPAPAKK